MLSTVRLSPVRAEDLHHPPGRDPRIHTAQQRAVLGVNRELVLLYWRIGCDIMARQSAQGWGTKVIERLARNLHSAFPDVKDSQRAT